MWICEELTLLRFRTPLPRAGNPDFAGDLPGKKLINSPKLALNQRAENAKMEVAKTQNRPRITQRLRQTVKMLSIEGGWLAMMGRTLVISALALPQFAQAACGLQITSAGSCLADGTAGTPQVGDAYGLNVTFNVHGTPSQPFRIKWTIANVTNYFDNINVGPGGYWWYFDWWVNLDDPIPWSVTLDPDGVSGNTNLVNNVAIGTFTPIPPTTTVELYSPQVMQGSETSILNFQPGSGTIGNLWVFFGVPTSHGSQQVISVSAPPNAQSIVTAPYSLPLLEIARTNVPAAIFQDSNAFVAQLSSIRVNPALLRTVTWADMSSLTTNWTQWLAPDPTCESSNVAIANFVQQSLPANYQTTLTPYDTARTLHRAVMKKLTYKSPPPCGDAVGVLQAGFADCGGFSALLTACLRNVGIPARTICGFWQGVSQWHVRVEFHLPGVEWVMADPTLGNGSDPTGTYAYEFGDVPDANDYLAVDVGDQHRMLNNDFGGIQVPNWWWTGGATFNSYTAQASLQAVSATGALQATITPVAAVASGAQWQLEGGTLQSSGSTVSNLPAGNYIVTFTTISGWTTPSNQTVAVTANQTNTVAATYTKPGIASIGLSGTNLVLNGMNGLSGATYYVLMSTNLTRPLSQWTPVATNVLSASGNFTITVTNTVTTNTRQRFYVLETQ